MARRSQEFSCFCQAILGQTLLSKNSCKFGHIFLLINYFIKNMKYNTSLRFSKPKYFIKNIEIGYSYLILLCVIKYKYFLPVILTIIQIMRRNQQIAKQNFGAFRHQQKTYSTAAFSTLVSTDEQCGITTSQKTHSHSNFNMNQHTNFPNQKQRQNQIKINDTSLNKRPGKFLRQDNKDYHGYPIKTQVKAQKNSRHQKKSYSEIQAQTKEPQRTKQQKNSSNDSDPPHGILISVDIQGLIPQKLTQNHQKSIFEHKNEDQNARAHKDNLSQNQNNNINKIRHKKQLQLIQFECKEEILTIKRASPPPRQRLKHRQNFINKATEAQQSSIKSRSHSRQKSLPKTIKKCDSKTLISNFASTVDQINNLANYQSLLYLVGSQNYYCVNPKYLEECQQNFTWSMRASVVEWTMEVSDEFALKRETFHISVNLFDRFLAKEKNLAKNAFQAIAAACMFIASKLQEKQPKCSEDFAIATGRLITAAKLKQYELRICKVLQFRLNPPTLYRWANYLMLQWDYFSILNASYPFFIKKSQIFFKQKSEQAYNNFRLLIQLIDCSTLEIQTAQYDPKLLVCSFMYLYLLKQYKLYSAKQIATSFSGSSLYLFDEDNTLNQIFALFLQSTFGLLLQDLLPTIQYCSQFFILPPNVDMPAHAKRNQFIYQLMELQQYEAFQTFDSNMVKAIITRRKKKNL